VAFHNYISLDMRVETSDLFMMNSQCISIQQHMTANTRTSQQHEVERQHQSK